VAVHASTLMHYCADSCPEPGYALLSGLTVSFLGPAGLPAATAAMLVTDVVAPGEMFPASSTRTRFAGEPSSGCWVSAARLLPNDDIQRGRGAHSLKAKCSKVPEVLLA
jgi:hypothetical protein